MKAVNKALGSCLGGKDSKRRRDSTGRAVMVRVRAVHSERAPGPYVCPQFSVRLIREHSPHDGLLQGAPRYHASKPGRNLPIWRLGVWLLRVTA
eukprot:scaffold6807_cov139-Isochrysis_galbana.AAC.2